MSGPHNLLLRFVDLGLLLLMGLLAVAELNPSVPVALPGSPPVQSAGRAYLVTIDGRMGAQVREGERVHCRVRGEVQLMDCLSGLPAGQVFVAPRAGATMQQWVNVLDACKRSALQCMPTSMNQTP